MRAVTRALATVTSLARFRGGPPTPVLGSTCYHAPGVVLPQARVRGRTQLARHGLDRRANWRG
jgi:hypothetical protein